MTVPGPRLSMEPLLAIVGGNLSELGRRAGMDTAVLHRDRLAGGVTPNMADKLAVVLGRLPGDLWGDEWWDLPDGVCGPAEYGSTRQSRRRAARVAKRTPTCDGHRIEATG